jgi:hypothetical protein
MAQALLPFKYQAADGVGDGQTALAGLGAYLDLAQVLGVPEALQRHMRLRAGAQGYTDRQVVMSLLALQFAGGDCVDDLDQMEADGGFGRLLQRVELAGLPRPERRVQELRWRRGRSRSIPSPSACRRYLDGFRHPEEEARRGHGSAFIPAPSEALQGLGRVNRDLVAAVCARKPTTTATLDIDATLIEVEKREALFCYQGYRAYQPLNVWWAEPELLLHTEFRDGNVPAGFENRRVLEEALEMLPDSVAEVFVRTDTAGYDQDLLRMMAEGRNPRFGVIRFAVGADMTQELRAEISRIPASEWKPYRRGDGLEVAEQEWAEVLFVPNWVGRKKSNPDYRYLAVRERLRNQPLPGMAEQLELDPEQPTAEFDTGAYKIRAVVTNLLDWEGDRVIRWHRERCGKSEHAHDVLKNELAGGTMPSKYFGVNAAWWLITVLAMNLNQAMKSLVLAKIDASWAERRLKAVRFHLIRLPGRVTLHARELIVRVSRRAAEFLGAVRRLIRRLIRAAPT